jgi:FKBP-type peptidyl-prolyl cis-trans isomerase FklB
MKKCGNFLILITVAAMITFSCSKENRYSLVRLKTAEDSVSYYLGIYYGSGWKQNQMDSILNNQAFAKGVNAAFYNDSLPVSMMAIQDYLNKYFMEFQNKQLRNQYKDYIAENKAFLEDNAKNDSVVTLPSGLQYKILIAGNGNKPLPTDKVKVKYQGSTIDGRVFDSSEQHEGIVEFQVNQLIPGWTEGLQLMPIGSKYRLYIPENLAYSSQPPQGSGIMPFSVLIFDVELLEIMQ